MNEEKGIIILMCILAVLGNIVCIVAVLASWILDLSCKWVWLVAALGWGLFSATLADFMQTVRNFREDNRSRK